MSLRTALEGLPTEAFRNDRVSFRAIRDEEDLGYATCLCELTEEQKELVNPAGFSIGRAYLRPEDNYPCVILNAAGEQVGFISLCVWLGSAETHGSWSYFIDVRHQGKGYGRAAAELAVQVLKAACGDRTIRLSAEEDNEKAQRLYRSLGFRLLDERDGDDLVFEL